MTDPHVPKEETTTRTRRVLLAEDNPANRKLVLAMLAKLGYSAHAVKNGLEAVEAVGTAPYDVVLMDCRMPEMDGFKATGEIRGREDPSARLPIIAITADAMEGDRRRCLEAGMDDYLSKPVSFEALAAALEKWTTSSEPKAREVSSDRVAGVSPGGATTSVLDEAVIADLRKLGSDRGRVRIADLISTFLQDAESNVRRLRRALEDEDRASISERLHTLTGSAATFGAQSLAELTRRLMARSAQMDPKELGAALDEIRAELDRAAAALRAEFPPRPADAN